MRNLPAVGMTMIKRLLPLLLLASPAFAQTSFYTNQATQAVSIIGSPQPVQGPIPFAGVRVCNLPLTQTQPCLPLATITDSSGNTLSNSIGSNFGQFTSDSFGRFTFGCTTGANLRVQWSGASNTPQGDIPITCPGSGTQAGGTNVFSGTNTFTGLLNCKNIEASIFCIDTTNTQGWTGSDAGAQINSAIAAWPSTGGRLLIASGVYSVSTPITGAQNGEIQCSASPATSSARAVLTFTPATGNLITWSNSSFGLFDCDLKTTTSTTSVALQLTHVNYKTNIQRNHINGFFGGIAVTGDGVSAFSTGVNITDNLVDGLNANCGGGAGYGVNIDHARDVTFDKNQFYSVTDCATGIPMILDTGVGGIWMAGSTFEQGLHAGIIRNTNQGGAYGGVPAAIFAHAITWDLPPGGDALLFDSTLGTGTIRFFCASCWAAGAGKNTAGTVITAGAVGFNIQGGSDIHFVGGISRINASWGAIFGTAGTSISIDDMEIHANNQGNTAGVGGVLIAGPTNWRLTGNRSGNVVDSGGFQAYGADISGASTTGYVCANDFANNNTNQYKLTVLGNLGTNTNVCGTGAGFTPWGNLVMPGATSGTITIVPPAVAGSNTLTWPAATDTLVGKATTDSLTNKTFTDRVTAGGSISLTGTGACSTFSATSGGAWAGSATCSGTTGAATVTITPGTTAPHFWLCFGSDITAAHLLTGTQTGFSNVACTISWTSVTNADNIALATFAY